MAKDKTIDFNALGQAIDTTFGRSSTKNGASKSVKMRMLDAEKLEVRYMVIVNLVSEREMVDLKKRYKEESDDVINSALKVVKETYKDLSESSIKFKQVNDVDSFEVIDLNIYNGKKTAYFRRTIVFEMS